MASDDFEGLRGKPAEPRKKRGYRNPEFALKRGLPLNEEARDTLASK